MLSACAGRAPNPVQISQPRDTAASCAALQAEIAANDQKISDLGSEKAAKVGQNIAAGVAGLFIWPLWFAMDFQGAASTDQEALEQRNAYLGQLAAERCGGAVTLAK